MKRIITSLLLVLISTHLLAQVTWSAPITVYTGSGANLHSRISLNRAGSPYVIWGRTDTRVYFSKWNGSSFSTPIVPSGSLTVFAQSWAGPDMAAYGDTVYVSMKVTPENVNTNYSYLAHSYNGGITFSAPVRIDNIDTSLSRFPIVTTTSTGSPLVAFMKFNSSFGDAHYVVARSSDFGATFSSDVLASGSAGTVCDCCPATILSAGSTAIMLFRNNLSNIRDIWAGISTDGGITFANHLATDNTNWFISSCPASGPDGIVIGDSIYNVFMSTASGTARVYLSNSSISSLSSSTSLITGTIAGLSSQNYPRIANAGNAAAVVWKQNISGTNSLAFSFANNISTGFSGYSTIATGSGLMNADVAMNNGNIHIVWEDDNTGNVMYLKGTYLPTSAEEINSKELIEIYPNPANDNFTVASNSNSNISYSYLIDYTGKHYDLIPTLINGKPTFNIKTVPNGLYYFFMSNNSGKIFFSKLLIENKN